MSRTPTARHQWLLLSSLAALCSLPSALFAASDIYWCPDRASDQRYSGKPEQGCIPLVDSNANRSEQDVPRNFKIENLQKDVSDFLSKYRQFLECCRTDLTELGHIEELGDEVGDLLASTQAHLSNYSLASRGIVLTEIIPRVAKARADLRILRARLQEIAEAGNRRDSGDYAGNRATAVIRDIEDSIERDITVPNLPTGPKTGTSIGMAPAAGPSIGKTPKTGVAIGIEGKTGQEIGVSPKSSSDIGSSGPTGFAIGGGGKAGPAIGESTFNNENSSGVGSSLERSTVGSSLGDSTVGSSLGTSSIGSTLQGSTPPDSMR